MKLNYVSVFHILWAPGVGYCSSFICPNMAENDQLHFGDCHVPPNSGLDLDGGFDGRSMCLLGKLATFNNGACAIVEGVIYVAERGVYSTSSGWVGNYYISSKAPKLPKATDNAGKGARMRLIPATKLNLHLLDTDVDLSDIEERDFDGDAEYQWGDGATSDGDVSAPDGDEEEFILRR